MSESRLAIVIDSKDTEKDVSDLTKRLNALEKAGIRVTGAANDNSVALDKSAKSADKYSKSTDNATKRMNTFNGIAKKVAATVATIGFSALIKDTLNTADELGKLSTRLGESVENLSRLQYAARLTGVTTQTLNMGLQRMTRRVSEAANGTGEAVGALEELNLSAEEMNRLSPAQQFEQIADALQDVENPADKVRLAMKLLDSEGVALIQTMEGGSEAIRRMGEESDRTGNTISAEFAAKAAEANDAITKLTATGQGLMNEFVVLLAPALQKTAEFLSDNATEAVIVTGAVASLTVGLKAARLAQIAFNTAVKANPYVLIASLIGTATAALIGFQSATDNSEESSERFKESVDKARQSLKGLTTESLKYKKSELAVKLNEENTAALELQQQLEELRDKIKNSGQLTPQGGALPIATSKDFEAAELLNRKLEKRREVMTKLRADYQAINQQLYENTKLTEESTSVNIISNDQVKEALSTLQTLRQGYDEAGLAREKYADIQKQLNILLREGEISERTYAAALAEAAKQRDDAIFKINEAKSAYESLRQEFDKMSIAYETFDTKVDSLDTLLDRGLITLTQYTQAVEQLGKNFKQSAIEADPMLKAQDDLSKKYIENSALLDALRQQQAASQYSGPASFGIQLDTQLNSANEAISGLGAPEYNANDLEATAGGMLEYEKQYEIRLEQLKEFENEKYGVQEEATAAREALEKSHEEKMKAYREQMLSAQVSSTANMFGSLLSVSSQYFGESSALSKTFFYAQQAAQIAQSIMSINTGIANASALPFPANIPAMASVVSATAGLVGNIMSVSAPPSPNYNANTNFAGEFATGGNIPKGKWGIVGETGQPEIVHGPASVTGVKDTAKILQGNGGNTVNISVNYTNNGNTSEKDARSQGTQIADLVKAQVLQVIQQQTKPGGLLY